jgi:hypothetical protein
MGPRLDPACSTARAFDTSRNRLHISIPTSNLGTRLPAGQSFFAVTRLRDAAGRSEQVFVAVSRIEGGRIYGRIWSRIQNVGGFQWGQPYDFPETELVDWLIAHPDGSEEGNFVGKFLDNDRG